MSTNSSLNAILSTAADQRLYNPNRDLAHNFPCVVEQVAVRMDNRQWEAIHAMIDEGSATAADVVAALQCFINFVAYAREDARETMESCLQRSGFLSCPESAQVAVMAYIGNVMTGLSFQGIRETSVDTTGSTSDMESLMAAGNLAANAITRCPGPATSCPILKRIYASRQAIADAADARYVGRHADVLIFQDNHDRHYYQVTVSRCERPANPELAPVT